MTLISEWILVYVFVRESRVRHSWFVKFNFAIIRKQIIAAQPERKKMLKNESIIVSSAASLLLPDGTMAESHPHYQPFRRFSTDFDDSNQKKYRGICKRSLWRNPIGAILACCCRGARTTSTPTKPNQSSPPRGGTTATRTTASAKRKFWWKLSYVAIPLVIAGTVVVQRLLSSYMGHRRLIPAPVVHIYRQCPALSYVSITEQLQQMKQQQLPLPSSPVICLTTLTDHASQSSLQRFIRWRNFDSILNLTMANKQAYVDRRANYYLFDGSHLIDTSRPPAWTKVLALQYLLDDTNHPDTPRCDWIVWMDADTVIMNMDIAWEDFLPATKLGSSSVSTEPTTDSSNSSSNYYSLVIGSDKGGGYNSGVLAFRNNDWTRSFLQHWWDMTDFVRPPGLALSGDNASLKHYLAQLETTGEFAQYVVVPPRCRLNSFAVLLSPAKYEYAKNHLDEFKTTWYLSADYYHQGDFIAHFPGIDNKEQVLKMFLDLAQNNAAAPSSGGGAQKSLVVAPQSKNG
jgi:galactosyl transferase GMA12/MNN10 family